MRISLSLLLSALAATTSLGQSFSFGMFPNNRSPTPLGRAFLTPENLMDLTTYMEDFFADMADNFWALDDVSFDTSPRRSSSNRSRRNNRLGMRPSFLPFQGRNIRTPFPLASVTATPNNQLNGTATTTDMTMRSDSQPMTYATDFNVRDTPTEYLVTMDIPGVAKSDINITAQGNLLTIAGSRKVVSENHAEAMSFSRSFTIDNDVVDVEKITAKLESGVLNVHIPKKEVTPPPPSKQIDIQ